MVEAARVSIRSLSIPTRLSKPPSISHHVRSVSLPRRSHSLISQLKDEINELKVWVCDALNPLRDFSDSLHYIIQLPRTQESLRYHRNILLENYLRFVDVYGVFQSLVLGFKVEQVGIVKTRDKFSLCTEFEGRLSEFLVQDSESVPVKDIELVFLFEDFSEVTVLVSVAVFRRISVSCFPRKGPSMPLKSKKPELKYGFRNLKRVKDLCGLKKKEANEISSIEKIQDLEWCIGGLEAGGEKVFRKLINTRVLLLHSLSQ
ncbi:hypothetical protein K2173_027916 [Erythroxylum novogranatense]|uniref:Uncharacterized protein n=1 Tax=Erythroxylum novogranatense TaxID=1862640 RepID=A0AAV8U3N4_9ROSI|nr:hypothetical protein K2173_027916 [Erythroxylum novogranatense]